MRRLLCAIILVAACQQSPAQHAGTPSDSLVEVQAREIASVLRCPECQGLSIQDSPSPLSQEIRSVVHEQLKAGKTPEEIKAYFVSRYGEWILLQPEPHGFNLAIYILPAVMLLGGAVLVVVLARRWSRQGSAVVITDDEMS